MLREILNRCADSQKLSSEEVVYLLSRTDEDEVRLVFEAARQTRRKAFGDQVFLYGFVYFSTYCQNNCTFCYYRKDNPKPPRYRKTPGEVLDIARELKASGVHLIDLTTGDDPYYTQYPERLAAIVKAVKDETGLPVMVSPGVLDRHGLELIARAGADWYALYQETHNASLFSKLRLGQSYDERLASKTAAEDMGLLIEEGLLTGVGESPSDRARSFEEMKRLRASQVRTMTFVPQDGAPLAGEPSPGYSRELMNIAVMRLVFPDVLIPASLDVEGLRGLEKRLMAGANVVTSIIPPGKGFAGVASCEGDINEGYRTVAGIQETLDKCRVKSASARDYDEWVAARRKKAWKTARCS